MGKQNFTNNELYFIILLIILTFIKVCINTYIYLTETKTLEKTYSKSKDAAQRVHELSMKYWYFNIYNNILNLLYLVGSIYFIVANKIKTLLFLLAVLTILIRSILHFTAEYLERDTYLKPKFRGQAITFIDFNLMLNNILMLFVTIYFLKTIFVG
jgi:hypothetical protein